MDRRTIKTHNAIREAYFSLIAEKNTTKVSISEIARRADIDRKTFYLHFNSVDDVANEYIEEGITRIQGKLNEAMFYENPFDVETMFRLIDEELQGDIEKLRTLSKSEAYDKLWERLRDIMAARTLEQCRHFTDMPEEKLRIHVDFVIVGILDIYRRWLRGEYNASLEDMIGMLVDAAGNGVNHLFPIK